MKIIPPQLILSGLISSMPFLDAETAYNAPSSDSIFSESTILDTQLEYSKYMLSWQEGVTDKTTHLLRSYNNNMLEVGKIYLSGHATYSSYFEKTDTAGKFPILGRFPNQHGSDTSGKASILDNADVALTYAPTSWLSIFAHGIYTDIEFRGQEESQLREIFVTFGDLAQSPYYLSVGRKTVAFGNQESYNPITHSVNNHFYRVDTKDLAIELGYLTPEYQFAFTLIEGGRQHRVADSPGNSLPGNFAISGQYNTEISDWDLSIGAGYLYSSIYDSDDANHPGVSSNSLTERERNGVLNAWVEAKHGPLSFMGEISQTERDWPATNAPVQAITLQASYDTAIYELPTKLSVVYGRGEQGNSGDEFHTLQQLAVGIETFITPNFALSAEYVYNKSFVPLIAITRASDAGVETDTLILSGKLYF